MAGDDPLLAVRLDQNLDHAGHDDVEVVRGVPLPIEVVAGVDGASGPERVEHREFGVVEPRERGGVVFHGAKARWQRALLGRPSAARQLQGIYVEPSHCHSQGCPS